MKDRLRQTWARRNKRDVLALWIAARDTRTPWTAKAVAAAVAAYALSPIDLIPDAIPVLGWLDDATLLAFALPAILKLVPEAVMVNARLATERRFSKWSFWHSKV